MARRSSLIEAVLHPFAVLQRVYGKDAGAGDPKRPPNPLDLRRFQREQQNALDAVYRRYDPNAVVHRNQRYRVYDEMDCDPMVTSVLDAFAEETTQRNPDNGRIVWVEAPNAKIQKILNDFLEHVEADNSAFGIIRSIAKYGDDFEGVPAVRSNGIRRMVPYLPYDVARIEDVEGALTSFAPANDEGVPQSTSPENLVPYYSVIHFRLHGRKRSALYGDSLLSNSLDAWRNLQMVEDQVLIQRLLRAPDRLLVSLDTSGMSLEEAWEVCMNWQRYLHRQFSYNRTQQSFESGGGVFVENRDVVLPLGENNNTNIQNFPATNQNDLLRDLEHWLNRFLSGLGVPAAYLGIGNDRFENNQSLGRQDARFAKAASRLQFAYMEGIQRMCMIHLAFLNLDPLRDENSFRIQMSPISYFMELERSELLNMRADLLDRYLRLGNDSGMNMSKWVPFILTEIGKLPVDLVQRMLMKEDEEGGEDDIKTADEFGFKFDSVKKGFGYKLNRKAAMKELATIMEKHAPIIQSELQRFMPKEMGNVIMESEKNKHSKLHEKVQSMGAKAESKAFDKDDEKFKETRKKFREAQVEDAKVRVAGLRMMAGQVAVDGK